jgi:hypothetical protein
MKASEKREESKELEKYLRSNGLKSPRFGERYKNYKSTAEKNPK